MKNLAFFPVALLITLPALAEPVSATANTGFRFSCEILRAHLLIDGSGVWRRQARLMESQARWNTAEKCERQYRNCVFLSVEWEDLPTGCFAEGQYDGSN